MSGLYQGSTPKYLTRIRDENGAQLDPENSAHILEVRIWIYNSISGVEIAKFYLNTPPVPSTGWRQATVKDVTLTDKRVMFFLTAAETNLAPPNKNEIQIEVTVPDTDCPPDNERIIKKKGRFPDIAPAKS